MHSIRKYLKYDPNIYVVLISWILLGYLSSGIDPYIPNYIKVLGGSEADIGWIYGFVGLVEIPFLLLGGVLGDYIGRRRLIVSITSTVVIAYFIYFLALSPIYILVGMLIQTLTSLYRPSLTALIGDSLKPGERGRGFIFIRTIPDLLSIPAPFLIGFIIAYYGDRNISGYKMALMIGVILALSAFIFRLLFLKETLRVKPEGELLRSIRESFSSLKLWKIIPSPMKRLILLRIVTHTALGLYTRYLIRFAFTNGVTSDLWGSMYSVAIALGVLISLALLPHIDNIEHKFGILIGYLLRILGLALFMLGSLPGFIVGLPLIFMGRSVIIPFMRRYQTDATPHIIRARVMSIDLVFRNIFSSLGLFIAGLTLVYTNENLYMPLLTGEVLLLISAFLIITILPRITDIEE